jgi:hypothetical protein
MVLEFLTTGGILCVPDHISDNVLLNNSSCSRNNKRKHVREAINYFEYGRDNY